MKLTTLNVFYNDYGVHKGRYTAIIEFENESNKQTLKLDPTLSDKLLNLCADEIVSAGQTLAEQIRPAIEAATNPQLAGEAACLENPNAN